MEMKFRYEQVANQLAEKIENGIWKTGCKLPGEIELAKEFQVARSTIRETLNILQEKGMIEKKHGSGTYVIENKKMMENPLLYLNSVGKMISEAGFAAGSEFYGFTIENPSDKICEKLCLTKDEKVVIVNRGRTANRQPVAFSYNVLPLSKVGVIFAEGLSGSLFQILKEKCGIEVAYADTELKGISIQKEWDKQAIKYLGQPIVLMEQLHFDTKNNPVLFSFDYIRTDIVKLHIQRTI